MGAVTRWGTKAVGWVEALRNPTGAPTNVGFRKASTQPAAQVHPYFTGYCHVKGGGFHCPPTSNCAHEMLAGAEEQAGFERNPESGSTVLA